MMPFSKAEKLPGGILISPFDIYIMIPKDSLESVKSKIDSMSFENHIISSLFKIKYVNQEDIVDNDDPYYEKVFKNNNIFSRILMTRERAVDSIALKIGWIDFYTSDIDSIRKYLLSFIANVCKADMEQINQAILDTEVFETDIKSKTIRIRYLEEIYRSFEDIIDWFDKNEKISLIPYRQAVKSSVSSHQGVEFIHNNIYEAFKRLNNLNGDILPIHEKTSIVGFDVPDESVYHDPEIIVEVVEQAPGSNFPGLIITSHGHQIVMNEARTEGIFLYVCCLIRHYHGLSFSKRELVRFFQRLKNYTERIESFDDEDLKENNLLYEFKESDMPTDLKREFEWYKTVYQALFYRKINRRMHGIAYRYISGKDFYTWCERVMYSPGREPFDMAASAVRKSIQRALARERMLPVYNQVSLLSLGPYREKNYYLDVKPENMKFPNNERWKKLLTDGIQPFNQISE